MASLSFHLLPFLLLAGVSCAGAAALPFTSPPSRCIVHPLCTPPIAGGIVGIVETEGEYHIWAQALASADLSALPPSGTIFEATDVVIPAVTAQPQNSNIVPYHISPKFLPYSRLLQFCPGARIPNPVAGETIPLIGNVTSAGASVTHPELFVDGSLVIHGVGSILSPTTFTSATRAAETSQAHIGYIIFEAIAVSVAGFTASYLLITPQEGLELQIRMVIFASVGIGWYLLKLGTAAAHETINAILNR